MKIRALLAAGVGLVTILALAGPSGATTKRATVPGKPSVRVSAANLTGDLVYSATVSWAAPSDGGSAITGYYVARNGRDSTGGGAYSTTVSTTRRSFTFTLLGISGNYTFSVAAVNRLGRGPVATVQGFPKQPAPTNVSVLTAQYPSHQYASTNPYGGIAVQFTCQRGLHWVAGGNIKQPSTGASSLSSGVHDFDGDRNGTCTGSPQIAVVIEVDVSGWNGGTEKPFSQGYVTASAYVLTSPHDPSPLLYDSGRTDAAKSVFLI